MQSTVSNAIRAGRLTLLPDGGIDPKLLRTKWRASQMAKPKAAAKAPAKTDTRKRKPEPEPQLNADGSLKKKRGRPLKKPTDAPPTSASEYARVALDKERSLAGLRQLEYERAAGELVSLDAARRSLFEQGRAARDAWLNWPVRVAPHVAAELGVEPDDVLRVLTRLVHEQVSALGEPDGSGIRSAED